MKIEIWSDVVCPWCYIGKRKFETALADFKHADQVEIEYKSYQLSPDTKTDPSVSTYEYLSRAKGISLEESKKMHEHVTRVAASVGLEYQFDKAVTANTFNAHRFLHFAKAKGTQAAAKELLCKAYFTDGLNIDDHGTLIKLGEELGLNRDEVMNMLKNNEYADAVEADIREAAELGLRGVPFYVFDRQYGVSGAQDPSVFLKTIEKAYDDWLKN